MIKKAPGLLTEKSHADKPLMSEILPPLPDETGPETVEELPAVPDFPPTPDDSSRHQTPHSISDELPPLPSEPITETENTPERPSDTMASHASEPAQDHNAHKPPVPPAPPSPALVKAKSKFRFPIAIKLVSITVTLLLLVTSLIAMQSSEYFESEVRETHQNSNQNQSANRATEVEGLINNYIDKTKIISSLLLKTYSSPNEKEEALNLTFKQDRDLVRVEVIKFENKKPISVESIVNDEYLKSFNQTADYFTRVRSQRPFPFLSVFAGGVEVINSNIDKGIPLLSLGFPLVKDDYGNVTMAAVADIRLDRLQKTFSSEGAADIYLIDRGGVVLAHPDDQLSLKAVNLKNNPIVKAAIESQMRFNHLPNFENPEDGRTYYGVFNKTSFGISVIAQIPEDVILEPARLVQRRAFYIGGVILSAALFFVFLFSISLTSPIEKLLELTHEIASGNFDVNATAKVASADEVGDLAAAFDDMTFGLKEREKAKDMLSKFHGSNVAQSLLQQDQLNLGGTRKHVAVLFSDLRDFTKFSEGHSPEEVVEMLNEYFEVMVSVVEKNKGTVNKFIGDAIMAMWGAPDTTGDDIGNAVMAALEMRVALKELNIKRINRGQTPIKIGAGVHCGDAIAGTIGSSTRMEYTVIGDTVNQASRIEASTKAFGADLLVSQEVYDKAKDKFVLEYGGAAEVKGKTEALKMYKIRGYIDENNQPVLIKTEWSDYKAEAADKVKVAA